MYTREQWLELRRKQGHKIETCPVCKYSIPEYLGIWFHIFKTGHDTNASQKSPT